MSDNTEMVLCFLQLSALLLTSCAVGVLPARWSNVNIHFIIQFFLLIMLKYNYIVFVCVEVVIVQSASAA